MIKVKKAIELRNEGPNRHNDIELSPNGREVLLTSNDQDEIKIRLFYSKKTKKPVVAYLMTLDGNLVNDDEILLLPVLNELISYLKDLGTSAFLVFSENAQMYIQIEV